jgi:hypothetical protein
MDAIDKDSYEGKKALVKWSEDIFDIRNYDREDVPTAIPPTTSR